MQGDKKLRDRLNGISTALNIVVVVRALMKEDAYGVLTITFEGMTAKLFIHGNVVMFSQPRFHEVPSLYVEFRDDEFSELKHVKDFANSCSFSFDRFEGDAPDMKTFREALKWRKQLKNMKSNYREHVMLGSIPREMWNVVCELYGY